MNFGMGLTKVRFRDYLWGTALGILVGLHLYVLRGNPERGVGRRPVGQPPHLEGILLPGNPFRLFPLYSQNDQQAEVLARTGDYRK